jgi:hypothetical protein
VLGVVLDPMREQHAQLGQQLLARRCVCFTMRMCMLIIVMMMVMMGLLPR